MNNEKLTKKRILKYREAMEKMVVEKGYFIQGVMAGENSFGYTVGRNDSGKPDFYIKRFTGSLQHLIEEAVTITDSKEWNSDQVFESAILINALNKEPTKFKLRNISPDSVKDVVLGMFGRDCDSDEMRVVEIVVSGENNDFN